MSLNSLMINLMKAQVHVSARGVCVFCELILMMNHLKTHPWLCLSWFYFEHSDKVQFSKAMTLNVPLVHRCLSIQVLFRLRLLVNKSPGQLQHFLLVGKTNLFFSGNKVFYQ